ncbi:hypothetical protein D0T25_17205 [Duganella sp. BJB488]|nr:hypothetical protein D0T26_18325 [Duganella sp. BJB489]RFP20736.1 hypothetical protein D0T25_17205 [Duganella sp. BJB488]RFP32208.1 hypothetical protein D0T24_21700 [Duganella sp. BJB480]
MAHIFNAARIWVGIRSLACIPFQRAVHPTFGIECVSRGDIPAWPDGSLDFLECICSIPAVAARIEFVGHPKKLSKYRREVLVFKLFFHQREGFLQSFKRFSKGFLLVYIRVVERFEPIGTL